MAFLYALTWRPPALRGFIAQRPVDRGLCIPTRNGSERCNKFWCGSPNELDLRVTNVLSMHSCRTDRVISRIAPAISEGRTSCLTRCQTMREIGIARRWAGSSSRGSAKTFGSSSSMLFRVSNRNANISGHADLALRQYLACGLRPVNCKSVFDRLFNTGFDARQLRVRWRNVSPEIWTYVRLDLYAVRDFVTER